MEFPFVCKHRMQASTRQFYSFLLKHSTLAKIIKSQKVNGPVCDLNPGTLAPKASVVDLWTNGPCIKLMMKYSDPS